MDIKNFDIVRCGSGWPASVDVRPIATHESYGVFAEAYLYRRSGEENFVQLQKHNADPVVAMFSFKWEGTELPRYWENSTVIWDSRYSSEIVK